MTQYNVALRVGYNGSQVSRGAARNAQDINRLSGATAAQGRASAVTATQNRSLASSYTAMAGAVLGFTALGFGQRLVSDAAASELLTNRIDFLAGSTERAAEVNEYLIKTSGDLNARYSTLADSYAKLIVLENSQTLTTQESRKVLEGMNVVAKALGATNVQVGQSMFGLTQALTAGTVRAEELNQVTEPLPGLLQSLDKAAGLASGGFRRMVVDGKVTSDFLKNTLIDAFKDFEGAAQANQNTLSASFANLGTQYDLLVKRLEQPINSAITPIINSLSDGLSALEQNTDVLDDVAFAAGALATVLVGRLGGSLFTATQGFIQKNRAATASLIATRNASISTATMAASELNAAKSMQLGAQRQLENARTVQQRTLALTQLARANGIAAAAERRHQGAIVGLTAATRAANPVMRGFKSVIGLLGGPGGLIAIAGLSLASYVLSADDASDSTEQLTQKTKALGEEQAKLNPYYSYNKKQSESALARYEATLLRAQTLLDEAKLRTNHSDLQVDVEYLKDAEKRVLEVSEKVQQLRSQVARFDIKTPTDSQETTDNGQSEALQKQLAQLENSLLTQEERIAQSYENRKAIVVNNFKAGEIDKQKHDNLLKKIGQDTANSIIDIKQRETQQVLDLEKARREKEQRDLEIEYENKLATIQGFYDRKALLEYEQESRIADAVAQKRILKAQGFNSLKEKEDHDRRKRVFDAENKHMGEMGDLVFNLSEWEKRTQKQKTDDLLNIGEFGFKQMAGQSKKAFAMYKAFSIAKAVMNTYEMATGAYTALAPIPIVGPALGAAAAAAAVAYGVNQVRTIKNQQYSGQYHGGIDYIPNEQTALLQRGERVVSPRQNIALTQAIDTINKGQSGGMTSIHYAPNIIVEGGGEQSFERANELEKQMYQRFEANLVQQFRTGSGAVYNAVKAA